MSKADNKYSYGFPPNEDIRDFSKLFKVSIPIEDYYLHYFRILDRAYGPEVINLFREFMKYRNWVHDETEYSSVQAYKRKYAMNRSIEKIKSSQTYLNLMGNDLGTDVAPRKDIRGKSPNDIVISFEFDFCIWE